MREITASEVSKLEECLRALAEHHNAVSANFKGTYPSRPYEITLKRFEEMLTAQTSHIAVVEDQGYIVGFCKIDVHGEKGELDYLVVLKEYRGKGYGKLLMDWAMQSLEQYQLHHVEVKVIDGNETIRLYEKYGFRTAAQILVNNR